MKWTVASNLWFYLFLSIAVSLKLIFLINLIRQKGFQWHWGWRLIVIGVIMILLSLLFKNFIPLPIVRNVLFFGAITLKVVGLGWVIVKRKMR
jgi:hypothetical protein